MVINSFINENFHRIKKFQLDIFLIFLVQRIHTQRKEKTILKNISAATLRSHGDLVHIMVSTVTHQLTVVTLRKVP